MNLLTFVRLLKTPKQLILPLGKNQLLNWIPDKRYLKISYYCEMGKKLNLEKPKLYSEKIQWIKIYDRKPLYPKLVDKYGVREYIKEKIGPGYLIPLIGVYDDASEIDWDVLPDKFVIKCTHSSHTNIICKDKAKLDIPKAVENLNKWMKTNLFWYGREWAYKSVVPRIVCEAFISDTDCIPNDYKVICCNGKARLIEVHTDRYGDHRLDYYDTDWNFKEYTVTMKSADKRMPRPELLDEMIEKSEALIQDTYISRVDWYIIDNKLFFGEITLYEASGYLKKESEDINRLFGDMCQLPTDT